ncbi:glycosyl transferase family 2 [Mesobacillus campisalis]|uniref:Glycosyl transferase family 2 n=1 Tax=Mesobacillus campisalis TaxID=1408103 RepID=A0A0M2SWF9_9BACI|nr:glycosyltransferase family 2 protein [Mesobacillus campisalis]KKK38894.1 glycosyl transferase family 2 [Mesobacillus campisalis]
MEYNLENQPLVSIIMPAFNCENYIGESINSVIGQTYQNWELIVIDDDSRDNTVNVLESISSEDNRIRFYKNVQNLGVSETRNRAISIAEGQWIAFLDSDDIWENNKLEIQMDYVRKLNAEFVFTGSRFINEEGKYFKGIFEVPDVVSYERLRKHNVISCSSVLLKKDFFKEIKMENDSMHEDYAVWLRVLRTGVLAYGVNEPLLIYRISRNSKSGNKIKTIQMTYKVFRYIGVNPLGSIYFMVNHLIGSIKKYKKINLKNL